MIVLAVSIALVGSMSGLVLSFHTEWPTGPTIVLTLGAIYLVSLITGHDGLIVPRLRPRRHYEA